MIFSGLYVKTGCYKRFADKPLALKYFNKKSKNKILSVPEHA